MSPNILYGYSIRGKIILVRSNSSNSPMRLYTSLALIFASLSLYAQAYRITRYHPAMGTQWSIVLFATDTLRAEQAIQMAFDRIDRLEQSMSDYRDNSELNQLRGSTAWQSVSTDLYNVLSFSKRLARHSRGAFDPTLGPLTKLWRRAFRTGELPEQERLGRAGARVNWKWLKLRKQKVRLSKMGMQLDLGGVAKGYTLDVVAAILRRFGYRRYLLDGGGDLLLGDPPPDRAGWSIAGLSGRTLGALDNTAIATSGSTYKYLIWQGVRYSHLIDPRTGIGVTDPRTVTVIGPRGIVADALASAASVGGENLWARLSRKYPEYQVIFSD